MISISEAGRALLEIASGGRIKFNQSQSQNFRHYLNEDPLKSSNDSLAEGVTERRKDLVKRMGFRNGPRGYESEQNPFEMIINEINVIEQNPVIRDGKKHNQLTPLFLYDVANDLRKSEFSGIKHGLLDERCSPEDIAELIEQYILKYHRKFNNTTQLTPSKVRTQLNEMKQAHRLKIHETKLATDLEYVYEVAYRNVDAYYNYVTKRKRGSEEQVKAFEAKSKLFDAHERGEKLNAAAIELLMPKGIKTIWMKLEPKF